METRAVDEARVLLVRLLAWGHQHEAAERAPELMEQLEDRADPET